MKTLLVASVSLGLAFASPLLAQEETASSTGVQSDPHAAMVDAMMPAEGLAIAHANGLRELRSVYENTAEIAFLDNQCPGTINLMIDTIAPIIDEYNEVEVTLRRQAMTDILRRELSAEHARAGAEFYSSELGRRLVLATMSNRTLEKTLSNAMAEAVEDPDSEAEISAEDLEADNARSARAGVSSMNPEDVAEIGRTLLGEPWFAELRRVQPMMSAAGVQIMNSDFAPELDAKADRVIDAALGPHLEKCGF